MELSKSIEKGGTERPSFLPVLSFRSSGWLSVRHFGMNNNNKNDILGTEETGHD